MNRRTVAPLALAALTLGLAPSDADSPEPPIEVVITEGTNLAAALSPDGQSIALDLLGRIWMVSASGGVATPLTDPFGDARAPTWSPDGQRIAFQAYWAGDYDVWMINRDGSGRTQLTTGPFDDREPHWSPTGGSVVFSSDRGGSYDIWEVDIATGVVSAVTSRPDNAYAPAYGPDGERVAFVTDGTSAGVWTRAADGSEARIVDLAGGDGYGPSWSPDGSAISYTRITEGRSELYVAQSVGSDAFGSIRSDDDEDVFPFRASWSRDGSTLVYTSDGGVQRREGEGGREGIAFSATVTLDRPSYRKRLRSFDPEGPLAVRGIVSPALSPDGSMVAFSALGDLWLMAIGGEPGRLTDDPWVEIDPAWSPDGSQLAFGSDRAGSVELWLRDVATGTDRQLTTDGGVSPVWSPDGSEIAFIGARSDLQVIDVSTGSVRTVRSGLNNPGRPTWSPDGSHVAVSALWTYSSRFREGVNRALLVPASRIVSQEDGDSDPMGFAGDVHAPPAPALQTGERWLDFGTHVSVGTRGSDGPIWSPNGRLIAFVSAGVLWVRTVGPQGDPVGPAKRLNNELTADPSWSGDSRSILYLSSHGLRRVWLESGRIEDVPVHLEYQRRVATERRVVHAGRLFDGVAEDYLRDVDVVIEGNRIVRVVPHADALHAGEVLDASDGTVIPGLIEMHMHGGLGSGEAAGRQWLAYGVTSVRTPAADPYETVEERESYDVMRRLGPRMFGTGYTIDGSRIYYGGAPALSGGGQIELFLDEAAELGLDVLKTYVRLPDAAQRRVIEDGHAIGLPITSHELYPAVAYGADGVEHVRGTSRRGYSTKVTELNRSYQDVVSLLGTSGMTITPTVGIYGGYGVVAQEDPTLLEDARIPAFIGPGLSGRLAGQARGDLDTRRRMVADMASLGRRVLDAGGTVVVGTDAPIWPGGWGLVAEMQILVQYGGMRPIDVLRGTTSVSAEAMGYGSDLGVVRPGALADLVVLDGDPLADITAVRKVTAVVRDGRPFTLGELLSRPSP